MVYSLSNKRAFIIFRPAILLSLSFYISVFSLLAQNSWEQLPGINLSEVVNSLRVDSVNDQLIIGGQFLTEVNGVSTAAVFKWSSDKGIQIIDTNNSGNFPVFIPWDIINHNDSFYIAGDGGIAVLAEDSFSAVLDDGNMAVRIWDINSYGDGFLLSVGLDKNFMHQPNGHLIYWDGETSFSEFQNISNILGGNPSINATQVFQGELYAVGSFYSSGGAKMKSVLKWDGLNWVDLNEGLFTSGEVWICDMEVYKGELYVAGRFKQNGDIKESHIARWDGTQWKPVGGGVTQPIIDGGIIRELHVYDDYLYVGGNFISAGGVPAKGVARWDGQEWCGCVGNITETVETLTHYRDTLYIGGHFGIYTPNDTIYSLARFIGTEFADTCGSINVGIKTLATQQTQLLGYPNPVNETLTLKIPKSPMNEVTVSIYTTSGQVVREEKCTLVNQELQLRVNTLPNGMYIGEIRSQSDAYRFSFVKD